MRTDSEVTPNLETSNSSKSLLYLACAISVLWIVGLLMMAACSTNLPVLNPRQIERASLIVTGIPIDIDSGRISVESIWKGLHADDTIVIDNLSRTEVNSERSWIFVLVESDRGDGIFEIAPYAESIKGQDPNRPQGLLIYPASPQLEQELKSILESRFD